MTEPPLVEVEPGHLMSCHIPLEELRRLQRRSTDADAPVLTTPAGEEDSGEVAAEAVVRGGNGRRARIDGAGRADSRVGPPA